jgi:hypothetical protein
MFLDLNGLLIRSPKPQREVRLLGPPLQPDPGFPGFLAFYSRSRGDVPGRGVPHGSAGIRCEADSSVTFRSLGDPSSAPAVVGAWVWSRRSACSCIKKRCFGLAPHSTTPAQILADALPSQSIETAASLSAVFSGVMLMRS